MNAVTGKAALTALLMAFAAGLAKLMTPTAHVVAGSVDLEALIPLRFADWRLRDEPVPVAPLDPRADLSSKRIYDQVLMRTYVDAAGNQVMLAVAYGSDQSDRLKVHRPEVCYTFQGFRITARSQQLLAVDGIQLPVKRLVAVNGVRVEPVTYWIKVGESVVTGGVARKLAQLRYGLTGTVPEGMLVRVSSIDKNTAAAFRIQEFFVRDLVAALDTGAAKKLIGIGGSRV